MIDEATLRRCFAPLEAADHVALAVSGGADSLALTLLAKRWRDRDHPSIRLTVLTVDHGLRPESAEEAETVARVAASLGLSCQILRWHGPHPLADVEAAARAARYRLLIAAAREMGAGHLAVAHHRDDQAETFLLRLARGSGVYGLAGMARLAERDSVRIVRPLLDLSHSDLLAVIRAAGLDAAEDPHNRDERFARARIRALASTLAREGLTAERLAATAGRLRRAAAALDHYTGRLLAAAVDVDPLGAIRLSTDAFRGEPEEVRFRALARILRAAGGAEHVPRLESLVALEAALGDGPVQRTLAGVVVSPEGKAIRFERELGRAGLPDIDVSSGFDGIWDGRFHVAITGTGASARLAALGPSGRTQLNADMRSGSMRALEALPALWSDGVLIAVPTLAIAPPTALGIKIEAKSIVGSRLAEGVEEDES
ncbi:tRNA lysidine(34) synthetase TilS [Kaistia algarum]|uniref:tRNA lysidine(34) synthetase TilS n=1 Tax=Kaistia algarum TaxID=2083279 RepID=UPI00140214A4|nr:tRNA lysidine(34) synthetase TilS [Kaistia algarum]MCX5516341.1 tRNA lysidine(34) synthetase TilS [Kaistia algarum]